VLAVIAATISDCAQGAGYLQIAQAAILKAFNFLIHNA
jgi:hypothetical protein